MLTQLKRAGVRLIGRERANQISAPYYDWLARRQTLRRLKTLPTSGLWINIGCGYRPLDGWVNLDRARGPQVDIIWDITKGLPFANQSCDALFSEHVIEHLTKSHGEGLLRECYRVLQPGGVLRVSTPDASRYLASYAGDGKFLAAPHFSRPMDTPMDRINSMMRQDGLHLWTYDACSLCFLLNRAGFARTLEQSFGVSVHAHMAGLDAEARAFESLYIEAIK